MARLFPHLARSAPAERQRPFRAVTLGVSLATAAGLGLMLYLATTSLPYFATSPTTDRRYGALNSCVLGALRERAVGFAVGMGGKELAAFGGTTLVWCRGGAEGGSPEARVVPQPGVQAAAFDETGALWFTAHGSATLWRLSPEPSSTPKKMAELPLLAIVGHADGVLALEYPGRLVSFAGNGEVRGQLELWGPVEQRTQLLASHDGTHAALLTGGGVIVVKARDATLVRAEAPCEVEHLWWLEAPSRARLVCGPEGSWSLTWDVEAGTHETAPLPAVLTAVHVPRSPDFVEPCEGLPCSVPAP